MIDLRSDTVTRPTATMRAAMAAADVGDDDYRDDPTVIRLEERAADLLGKPAAIFVPSGVMSNLIAALAHCPADRRVLALDNSHVAWSLSSHPRLAGLVHLETLVADPRGRFPLDRLGAALDDHHHLPVGLLTYENTHNLAGGTALAPAETAETETLARARGIPIHLDGARIFNAAVALGLPASTLATNVDSVTFCLSKGLGAPIGSVLCGDAAFIERAREERKFLGGTMRQASVIAAAGLIALDTMIDRLADDHANARWLAARLAQIPGLTNYPERIETNIIFLRADSWDPVALKEKLLERGVAVNVIEGRIRLVTHADLDRPALERAVAIIVEGVKREA